MSTTIWTIRGALSGLEATPTKVAEVIAAWRKQQADILKDEKFSDEHKAQLVDQARATMLETLSELERETRERREKIDTAAAEMTAPDETDLSAHAMAWDRARRMLEAGKPPEMVARVAAQAGDRAMFAALQAELPMWFRAQHERPESREAEATLTGVLDMVAAERAPLLSEEQRDASSIAGKLGKLDAVTAMNFSAARSEIEGRSPAQFVVEADQSLTQIPGAAA